MPICAAKQTGCRAKRPHAIMAIFVLLVAFGVLTETIEASGRIYYLDDFDYDPAIINSNCNDFFGLRGVWNDTGEYIMASHDSLYGRNKFLRLEYKLHNNGAGWWEHLTYWCPTIANTVFDASQFEQFCLSFKGGNVCTDRFYLELVLGQFDSTILYEITGVDTNWQERSFNLRDSLGEEQLRRLRQVAIVLRKGHVTQDSGTICFDNLYFIDTNEVYNNTDELLDLIEHKSANYFVDNANPFSGLMRDRASSWSVSSIACVGYGLAALGIGAERGWINRDTAAARARKVLDTIYHKPQGTSTTGCSGYKGFYYHMLNDSSATRAGDSELSSIDSGIFLAGVIFSREYFNGGSIDEIAIRNLADSICNRVDWDWMLDKEGADSNCFYMGWKPESGFEYPHWNYYTDEAILVCLLAIASGKVDSSVFYAWQRERDAYNGCDSLYQTWWGSLFTYFFASNWFNYKGRVDGDSVNWWDNSLKAAIANKTFCKDSSGIYKTYSDNSWGLSACLGPHGYNGGNSKSYGAPPLKDGPVNHDGTIPPYGAGSSIVFFSDDPGLNPVVQALKNYYDNYPKLWGLYGFEDAYNLGTLDDSLDDWYADDHLGIDVGSMLVSIENYRAGLVWSKVEVNPQIKSALNKIFKPPYGVNNESSVNSSGNIFSFRIYPNPCSGSASISFHLPKPGRVIVKIYNILGQLAEIPVDGKLSAGYHKIHWPAKGLANGIYLYRAEAGQSQFTGKLIIAK